MTIYVRKSTYHLRRRVPLRYKKVEPREIVAISLHTDSRTVAQRKAGEVWAHLIEGWEAVLRMDGDGARVRFEAAKEIADRRGFAYLSAPAVADLPLNDILARVNAVPRNKNGSPNQRIGDALLGGAAEPGVAISQALDEFWLHAASDIAGKSNDQIRRWKNPKKKAIKNLIDQITDKDIAAITRADMVKFRDWWQSRISEEGLVANSANKDMIHIGHVLNTANSRLGLGLDDHLTKVLKKLSFKDDKSEERDRPPFSDKWIREKILAPGALDGMNNEARCVVLAMVNTGARPSEIAGLLPEHIHLDADVPYISIEADGKTLKTAQSKRRIPLVGVSLTAMTECPKGFATYRFKDALSATVNKFMRENGLLETDKHVLYSLRHAFEDRMIAAEFDDRMRRTLFGHKLGREKYGNGPTLKHMHEKLLAIAL